MLTQEILDITPNQFWQVLPHEKRLLQKKRGLSRFTYFLLFRWFEKTASFPQDIKTIPVDLIEHGIVLSKEHNSYEDIFKFFENERLLNQYKQKIRKYFEFKEFHKDCPLLCEYLMTNIFKEKNDEVLKSKLCLYLKAIRTEIPPEADILELIKNKKKDKEEQFFSQIENLLSDKDKNYIDDYLLTSNDFDGVCQYLRQDSSDSTKEGVSNEINRLTILNQLPVELFNFISDINIKQRNIYRRRFLTDTPERTKRRTDASRYSLAIIFCFQRHQEAIDNLIEHLLYFIHQIKKTANKKQEKLNKEIGQQLGDLDSLYSLAEINRDFPKGIIEQVVYPSVSQETIDHLIKTRDFARQIKKKVRDSAIKKYSNTYRHTIFNIIDCLKFHSNNTTFLEALSLIARYKKSKLKYYPFEEEVPLCGLISKRHQKEITERDELSNVRILRKDYECAIFIPN